MPDIATLTTDIDSRLPNSNTHAQKVTWMNSLIKKVYRSAGLEGVQEFVASSSKLYALSTNCRHDKINRVLVSNCTASSDISSTTVWGEYKYAGFDDPLGGQQWFVPKNEYYPTTSYSSQISLYDNSTELRVTRIYYDKIPATIGTAASDSTTIPDLDEEYHDILVYGICEIIAESGNMPNFEKANFFNGQYLGELKRIRMDKALRTEKIPAQMWQCQEWKR
jgi:hypothetical protein